MTKIAALLTCFNRQEKTLACLEALFSQILPANVDISVYLVDDASTDGTKDAVLQTYPQVKIFSGDGNLFWNGGMRLAFSEAMKDDPDYYLWLNDDTLIEPEALSKLLATSHQLTEQGDTRAIVAGSTRDPQTGAFTYGGAVRSRWWHPIYLQPVIPTELMQPCDTMNGNCVLIPRSVVEIVGNLDSTFKHYAGDYDYGLRSRQKGCTIWIAPGYVGTCAPNPHAGRQAATTLALAEQLKRVNQPKGLALQDITLQPFEEWKVYAKRHGGLFWQFFWLLPYRRIAWLSLIDKLKGRVASSPY